MGASPSYGAMDQLEPGKVIGKPSPSNVITYAEQEGGQIEGNAILRVPVFFASSLDRVGNPRC